MPDFTSIKLLSPLIDLLFPRICPGCGLHLSKSENQLCISCLAHLPQTGYHLLEKNPVQERFQIHTIVKQAFAIYYFQKATQIQNIIHYFKYKGNRDLAHLMGYQAGLLLKSSPIFQLPEMIIPVPLHQNRYKTRGYNQSEWIGRGISKALEIPVANDILYRKVNTRTQTKLNAKQRWENVKNAFSVPSDRVVNCPHILVVDDVLTSGATMEACLLALSNLPDIQVTIVALATASI